MAGPDDRAIVEQLLDEMEPKERKRLEELLLALREHWQELPGPQTEARYSKADILGFGGAAGGGKTDLICGVGTLDHERVLIIRREKAQTEGIVQRLREILPDDKGYSSQHSRWQVSVGSNPLIEFGGLDNPGSERRWQGRPHDFIALDEATEMREKQARFILGWNRTRHPKQRCRSILTFNPPMTTEGRWIIKFFGPWLDKKHPKPAKPGELRWFTTVGDNEDYEVPDARPFVLVDGELVYDFDPKDHKPEEIITPRSRTFIPARVSDNPYYMESGYVATLQAMPEPARSRMLFGDFTAGMEDPEMQLIPTAWVEAAMARWERPERLAEMDSIGVDVAMGGRDDTIIVPRHGMWFDKITTHEGKDCTDGATVAGFILAKLRDRAPVHVDLFGVGAKVHGALCKNGIQSEGINVGDPSGGTTVDGHLRFFNLRSELWWRMREALDPENDSGIALPNDQRLLADLCAPCWEMRANRVYVEGREDLVKKLGRSPDAGSAAILALMDTMKEAEQYRRLGLGAPKEHDPYANPEW